MGLQPFVPEGVRGADLAQHAAVTGLGQPGAATSRYRTPSGSRPGAATAARPVRVGEEPGKPHRTPGRQADRDRQDRPPTAPRLPAVRGPTVRVRGHGHAGKETLDRWLSWTARCRIPAFVALGKKIRKHRAAINATLDHDLSNVLIESTNTTIKLLHRMAFGFTSAAALIALSTLALGGFRPPLPGRTTASPTHGSGWRAPI